MKEIKIKTGIAANKEKVWDYYTNPEHIMNWNFAVPSWHCPSASNEVKVGGKYFARMEARDESFGFDFEAIYDEVEVGERFTYTMTDNRKVKVSFADLGDETEITIAFEAENQNPIEMQEQGWQAILNNFKKYTEAN